MIYKTLQIKLKIEKHKLHYKPGMNPGAPEGWAVPDPLVTPVALLYLQTQKVCTTSLTYPWSFVTQMFCNG